MITGTCRAVVKPAVSKTTIDYLERNQDKILESSKKQVVKGVHGVEPSRDIWTKWHQNQLQTCEIKKDLATVNNSRYMGVRQVIYHFYPSFLVLFRLSACLIDFTCFPVDR